ncbi:MAG: hypothetical protein IT236_14490 [Bacteroidia bacterium]|nr:hypothetical protein [Bacteroidia bacterium]
MFLLIFHSGNAAMQDSLSNSTAVFDTAVVEVRTPDKAQEEEVFNDAKLKYKKAEAQNPGAMNNFLEWLAGKLFNNVTSESLVYTRRIILWTIIILSLIIVVRILWRSQLLWLTKPAPKATAFSFSDVTEDLSAVNFDREINKAIQNSDYRLAIRWLYLKTLFIMDQKKHIHFAPYKTNIDYRYELKDKNLEPGFISLSRIYEYVWYGQFVITEMHYNNYLEEFNQYQKRLSV